jgi:V-type H+-transporting ATPase subunit a
MFAQEFNEQIFRYKTYNQFLEDLDQDFHARDRRHGIYFDLVENEILEEDKRVMELIDSYTKIKENLEILVEKKYVYDKSSQLISANIDLSQNFELSSNNNSMILEEGHNVGLNFLAGVVKADDDMKMKRMIFRASKGRALPTFFDFVNTEIAANSKESSVSTIKKKIFTIFFQGGNESVLLHKLLKICDLFNVSRYNIPRREDIKTQIVALQNEITEKKNFLREAEMSIKNYLKHKFGHVRYF